MGSVWQTFRHITLPLVWPFIMVRRRDPDDRRTEDVRHDLCDHARRTRHVSETINILLYQTAFGTTTWIRLCDCRVFFLADPGDKLGIAARAQREQWR